MATSFLDGIRRRASSMDMSDRRELSLPDLKDLEIPRPDLAAAGRAVGEGVGALGKRLDEIGREVRQVRVVKGPEPRVAPAAGIALLGGLGAGMGLMYFLDPRDGQQRRERLMSRIMGLFGQAKQAINERRGSSQSEWDDLGAGETTDSLGSGGSLAADPFGASAADQTPFGASSTDPTMEAPVLSDSRI